MLCHVGALCLGKVFECLLCACVFGGFVNYVVDKEVVVCTKTVRPELSILNTRAYLILTL